MLPVGLFVLGFVAGAALLGGEAVPAHACIIAPFHERFLADSVQRAEVVAVGALEAAQGDAITLVVEEGLKGAAAGDRLSINNATNLDCYEAMEPGRRNYEAGTRVLVFLVPDTFGVAHYQVNRFGGDIFRVSGDALVPSMWSPLTPMPRIGDLRAPLRVLARTPYDHSREFTGACRGAWRMSPADVQGLAGTAEAIVVATVAGDRDGATVLRVNETYLGGLYGEITLNDHYLSVQEMNGCQSSLATTRRWWPPGRRVVALLVRDEFGVAEWRPALLGSAVWSLNDSEFERYDGIPLLSEVRQATIQAGFQPSVSPSDDGLPRVLLALVALLAVAVLALVTWLRVRRPRNGADPPLGS